MGAVHAYLAPVAVPQLALARGVVADDGLSAECLCVAGWDGAEFVTWSSTAVRSEIGGPGFRRA